MNEDPGIAQDGHAQGNQAQAHPTTVTSGVAGGETSEKDGASPTRDRLYFRQLLAGRDFAIDDPVARQMVNFVYLIGDLETGEAVMVDPAYAVDELLNVIEIDQMRCVGVLATHYHADHIGGDLMGTSIQGITRLLELTQVPVHVQQDEAPWVVRAAGVTDSDLIEHVSGDVVSVGDIPIELVHTPGHTPGSQCFSVAGRLVSGDTLFLDGCGRTDFPGGDPAAMYESLTNRLARFPDNTVLFPGHRYSPDSSATMGETRSRNFVFRPSTAEQWLDAFG